MQSSFAGGVSPWAHLHVPSTRKEAKEKPMAPRKKPEQAPAIPGHNSDLPDPEGMEIVTAKPRPRQLPPSKYESIFEVLKPGQAIKCKTEHAHAVANAMRSWQKRRNLGWKTAMTLDYGDGMARVFRVK